MNTTILRLKNKQPYLKKYFSSYWIRSAFYSFLQRFSLILLGVVNFMILIRVLSKPEMGSWALFLTITTIFETAKTGLLKNAHIKYVSSNIEGADKTNIASSSLLINLSLSLLFIILILSCSGFIKYLPISNTDLLIMLKWFIPGLLALVFFSHFEAIQQSHFDFKGVFAGYIIRQLSFFIVILIHFIFSYKISLPILALYQSASIILGALVIYIFSRKYLLFRFDPSFIWIKKLLGYGRYIFGSGLIANFHANLDQLMMSGYSLSSVAYYNACSRINNFVEIPSYSASEIIFPKISKASVEEGHDRVKYLYEKMVSILLSFTIPIGLFIIAFPKFVIHVIAGSQYLAAAPILQLYVVVSMISPMQNQAANVLNSIGKPHLCFVLNLGAFIAKLGINFACIFYWGFYGAAIGTLITSTLNFVLWYAIMQRQIGAKLNDVFMHLKDNYKLAFNFSLNFLKLRNTN